MANVDAAFGARPVRHLTGGQIRTNEYKIASGTSSNIFTGDFVKLLATGYIDVAAAGNRILGVFAGCQYTASDGEVKLQDISQQVQLHKVVAMSPLTFMTTPI